jgi:hypothetical protein
MPNAKPVRLDGNIYPSARAAAGWLREAGHPKASGAGISLAISRGQREYLGRAVEWATDGGGPRVTRRELRARLDKVPTARLVEILTQSEEVTDGNG